MEKIEFKTSLEDKGVDLRCRDSCPCHCDHVNLNSYDLPSIDYFK